VHRCAQASCGRLAQNLAAIRCAMVDAIPPSLGRRAGLPWERQPESALGRCHRVDYGLFDRSGGPAVSIQERGAGFGWILPTAGR